jgi:type I restriction enzyme, S subunit
MEQREGYKKTEIGWIPEDWDVRSLGKLGIFLKGKGIAKKDLIEEGLPCIRYGEIYTVHSWIIKKFHSHITLETATQSAEIQKDDILFAGSGETVEDIGKAVAYLGQGKAYAGGDVIILRPMGVDSAFISACLDIETSHKQKRKLGQGNSVVHIYPAGLKKLLVPLPPLPEQNKIASILTTVDDKISSIDSQIQQTEQLKKGLMEKLLTEGIGHTEFKDTEIGRIPEDWDVVKLSEIANFRRGSFPQPYGLEKWFDDENGYPFVQVYDVSDAMKLKETTKRRISDAAAKQSVFVKKGTLILTIQGSIGRVAITSYDTYIDRTLLIFQSYKCQTDLHFLMYSIYSLFNIEKQNAHGSTIKTITKKQLSDFQISFPPLPEQKQIATILSTVDDKLDILTQKKSQYQTLKKGLMAELLTGKRRVKV